MQQVIIAIHLMVVVALVILVLYQKSEGGALGMGGGQGGLFTGRGQANALTRTTGVLATIFFLTSIALTVIPAWERRAQGGPDWTKAVDQGDLKVKEIKKDAKPGDAKDAPAPEAGKDSIFDQLRRAQEKRQQSTPAPAPVSPPPAADAPKLETPKVEAPKSEEPALRPSQEPVAPKAETPAPAEAPKADAPKNDALKWEAPKTVEPGNSAEPAKPKAAEPVKPEAPAQWKSPTQ